MTPSQAAIDLVKKFEGLRLQAYLCPADILTIGYGHTANVKQSDICDKVTAEQWLMKDLQVAGDCVLGGLECGLTQNEFDALCSFTFNVGCANFMHSTLRLCLSRNQYQKAADEFPRWVHAKGVVLSGLVTRRAAERALFLGQTDLIH